MALVQIDSVSRTYQLGEVEITALKDVTLSIEEASFVSFVGPSGSGKTTFLNIISGLDRPTDGNVFMSGREITKMDQAHLLLPLTPPLHLQKSDWFSSTVFEICMHRPHHQI